MKRFAGQRHYLAMGEIAVSEGYCRRFELRPGQGSNLSRELLTPLIVRLNPRTCMHTSLMRSSEM